MTNKEINIAVAKACGMEILPFVPAYASRVRDPKVVWEQWAGGKESVLMYKGWPYDPRNKDEQALDALQRFISNGSLKAYIMSAADGHQVEIMTEPEEDHVSVAENASLSHAITDAILAAEEKRNV